MNDSGEIYILGNYSYRNIWQARTFLLFFVCGIPLRRTQTFRIFIQKS